MTSPLTAICPSVLRRGAVMTAMVLTLVFAAAACEPAGGCAVDCVDTVTVNPGTTATKISTTVKTTVSLTVYADSAMTNPVIGKSDSTLSTLHTITHGSLTPNTYYWFKVKATDEQAKVFTQTGSFKSLKRTLTVKITRINLTDDSDSAGDGEMTFGMRVGTTDFGKVYEDLDMASGTDRTGLSITKTIANTAKGVFKVSVEGRDDDCVSVGLCAGGTAYDYGHGSNSDWDWATASTADIVLPGIDGSGTWSATITSYTPDFTVSGTWTVSYSA